MFLAVMLLFVVASCHKVSIQEPQATEADSLIFDIGTHKEYERMREVTDSLEMEGKLSAIDANRWRGVSYYRQGQYLMAEVCYRKALNCEVKTALDQLSYNKSARRLSELLLVRGDYEGSLMVAMPAVAKMEESGIGSDIDYAILLNNIGCCQLNLGRDKEANESFLTAREHYAARWQSDTTGRGFQEAVIGTVYTSMAYINTKRYAESIYWIDRTEMLLGKYKQKPDARREYFDEYQGRIEIMRAVALQGLHKEGEASKAYQAFLQTNYSKTGAGKINANDYLVAAHRYAEASDNYRYLDKTLHDWGTELSLDNIQLYLLPKYHANAEAGRMDSAKYIGNQILTMLDSAITDQKNSTTVELATIYNTQQKEAEIAKQHEDLVRTRLIGGGVALVLAFVFFLVYTLHRRAATHRLAAAHQKLQTAYDQLEETTAQKERMASELRIARDIQMSMVPSRFPVMDDFDLYASMTPAKEVGGDHYNYLQLGDKLYFCVGDVSGKGVPASLFMAQATRLFHALASQGMAPAEICNHMNDELTEDNEQSMFVTMFICRLNMKLNLFEYCNAGHNPPVIGNAHGQLSFLDLKANAPIGLWPGLQFAGESIDDFKDRLLFIYTDGLNEAENSLQEQFGDEQILELLKQTQSASAQQIIEALADAVSQHRNGVEPNDDLTMMCLCLK